MYSYDEYYFNEDYKSLYVDLDMVVMTRQRIAHTPKHRQCVSLYSYTRQQAVDDGRQATGAADIGNLSTYRHPEYATILDLK